MSDPFAAPLDWIALQRAAMRDELLALADINSGTFNAAGVGRVADRLQARFAPLAASCERLDLPAHASTDDRGAVQRRPLGPALRLRQRPDAPLQVFLGGHMDTVFAADHPFQRARVVDD